MYVIIDGKLNKHRLWIHGKDLISIEHVNAFDEREEKAQEAEQERIGNAAWQLLADDQPVNNETIARIINRGNRRS